MPTLPTSGGTDVPARTLGGPGRCRGRAGPGEVWGATPTISVVANVLIVSLILLKTQRFSKPVVRTLPSP